MDKTSAVVIADAGPIIHLDELECLDVLADFGKVLIPQTVWQEVQHHRPLALTHASHWLVCQSPRQQSDLVSALTPLYSLHAGEQEALHLCVEQANCLLLTDDTAARLAAQSLHIAAHGTVGVLIRSIRRQTLTTNEVLALLNAIPHQTTLHIRPALLQELIATIQADTAPK
jgi:predicted nucleic acid-binding protein